MIKLKNIGAHENEIHQKDNIILLFSYETPVACIFIDTKEAFETTTEHGETTKRHINAFFTRYNVNTIIGKEQDWFNGVLD